MIDLKQTIQYLNSHDSFLIVSHRRPDGDALCSAAALCSGLNRAGKTAFILSNPETNPKYAPYVEKFYAPPSYVPAYVVSVDMADEKIIQVNAPDYLGKIDLSVDHHQSNTSYAARTLLLDKSSCGEIIYMLCLELCGSVTKEEASLIYIAAATDTGCFRYKNTSADTLKTASELVAAGAENGTINKKFFMTSTKSRLLLESYIIDGLEFHMDGELVIASISREMLKRSGASPEDLEDVAVVAGQIEGVETSITVSELEGGGCKASVRTVNYPNANMICRQLGGGGHGMAAGCSMDCGLQDAISMLLEAAKKVWKKTE